MTPQEGRQLAQEVKAALAQADIQAYGFQHPFFPGSDGYVRLWWSSKEGCLRVKIYCYPPYKFADRVDQTLRGLGWSTQDKEGARNCRWVKTQERL